GRAVLGLRGQRDADLGVVAKSRKRRRHTGRHGALKHLAPGNCAGNSLVREAHGFLLYRYLLRRGVHTTDGPSPEIVQGGRDTRDSGGTSLPPETLCR